MISTPYKLVRLFRDVELRAPADVFRVAGEISNEIQPIVRQSRLKPLSPFAEQVMKLAPLFLAGQYRESAIAAEIFRQQGVTPSSRELTQMRTRVGDTLRKLKKRGLIQLTTPQDAPLKLPKLREATPELMKKHIGLVYMVVRGGHRFLQGNWRQYLPFEDAVSIGMKKLARVIETHRSKSEGGKWAFSTVAVYAIAHAISVAAAKRRKQATMLTVLTRASEVVRRPSNYDDRFLEPVLQRFLKQNKLANHHLILWTLHRVFGHEQKEIAAHFKVRPELVGLHVRKVDAVVKRRARV